MCRGSNYRQPRGKKAFDALGILSGFLGTLIQVGWEPYRELLCQHRLCNTHHLRQLACLFEEMRLAWAMHLIDLLVDVCHEVTAAGGPPSRERIAHVRALHDEIFSEGEAANPRSPPSGARGRTAPGNKLA
jgi:transposase